MTVEMTLGGKILAIGGLK